MRLGADSEGHLSPTHFCNLPAIGAYAFHEVLSEGDTHGITGARGAADRALGDREQSLYLSWEVEDKE